MDIRKLPIGIQSFEDLRSSGYLYVDKTRHIWNLAQRGKSYFLSRPRRFGKSLLVSTMEAYFKGERELFDGLAIQALEDARGEGAWTRHPVVRFSLSGGGYAAEDGLAATLHGILASYESRYGIDADGFDISVRFRNVLRTLHEQTGKKVVVLVDEYDKPLLEGMAVDEERQERNRRLYKGFFSVLKDEDEHLRFVFFTGVTKFAKVSVFSDLNQLRDISLLDGASDICGITEAELLSTFRPELEAMSGRLGMGFEECLGRMRRMYDGYHFSPESPAVYNPFSLLNSLEDKDFGSYWFATGTPTFLVDKLMGSGFSAERLVDGVDASEASITDYRADNPDPIPLFYQTGYLTICGFDREFRIYSLRFPNDEVKYGFLDSLVPAVLGGADKEGAASLRVMARDLRRGDIDSFMRRLEALFAGIPYPEGAAPRYEREWRNQMYLVLTLLGQSARCEVHSSRGRCDCVVETAGFVYVFEFKLDGSVDEALQQIEGMGYAAPYAADGRTLLEVGVSFSTKERNVADWRAVRRDA